MVEYVQQPFSKAPLDLHSVLDKVPCSRYSFQMDLSSMETTTEAISRTSTSNMGKVMADNAGQPWTKPPQLISRTVQEGKAHGLLTLMLKRVHCQSILRH